MDGLSILVEYPVPVLDLIGISLILYGVFLSVMRIVKIEATRCRHRFLEYENTKRILIQKLIFGLDFLVAADLLRLISVSGIEDVIEIAIIVAIRSVLAWSLSKEVHLHQEKMR